MRLGEWAQAAPVSGIECVGLVKSCSGGEFPVGARLGTDGGLGRTINGSYAGYTRAKLERRANRIRSPLGRAGGNPRRSLSTNGTLKDHIHLILQVSRMCSKLG
jgi:hypothetical protein